ncbi:hypothetical protein EVAR_73866_1, partial [Eumeta japonica]
TLILKFPGIFFRGIEALRTGNDSQIFRGENAFGLSLRLLFEPYPKNETVPWGWKPQFFLREKLCQPGKYVLADLQRIFRRCCLPTYCFRDSYEECSLMFKALCSLVSLELLVGTPGLWKAQGKKGS